MNNFVKLLRSLKTSKSKKTIITAGLLTSLIVIFQNCGSNTNFSSDSSSSGATSTTSTYTMTTPYVQIALGLVSGCGLTAAGQTYCWGDNEFGELGNGTTTQSSVPVKVSQPTGVTFKQIVIPQANAVCGLTSAGQAYCWGDNDGMSLGNGTETSSSVPVPVSQPSGVVFTSLSVSSGLTCGLTADHQGYCWGYNETPFGAQGSDASNNEYSKVPVLIPQLPSDVTQFSSGTGEICALNSAGQEFCMGFDGEGDIGNTSSGTSYYSMVSVTQPAGVTFSQMVMGNLFNCSLTSQGQAYCWGDNVYGENGSNSTSVAIGVPTAVIQPAGVTFNKISASASVVCALTAGGQAYCWGANSVGQIGQGETTSTNFTRYSTPQAVKQPVGTAFSQISVGMNGVCALDKTGQTYCWGSDVYGALGDGAGSITTTSLNSNLPVKVLQNQ